MILYVELQDQGREFLLEKESGTPTLVPILGLLQATGDENDVTYNDDSSGKVAQTDERQDRSRAKEQTSATPGRLVVYGDSNCIDDSHLQKCTHATIKSTIQSNFHQHRDK